jgi:putative toxin-antitoxin system antitoxin component (TIGR02293 family)
MGTASVFTPTRRPEPILGTRILGLEARSDLQVVERLAGGLDTQSVVRLADHLGLSVTRVLDLASIKSSTFHDRKNRHRPLSAEESGRVYRLAKVTEAAEQFFGHGDAAQRWLNQSKVALGGKGPLTFAATAEGADYVLKLLGRMEHGVIS